MQHLTNLNDAQRIDDRPVFGPLRDYRNGWATLESATQPDDGPPRVTGRRVDTGGMDPAECCSEMGADDYPRMPRKDTMPAAGLFLLAVSSVLSIAALVHLAGWLGWLQ